MTAVLVFLGGMLGAPLRYLADRAVRSRHDGHFPWGTLAVNVAGCLVLGGLAALALSAPLLALLGTGFCGALTTYSTFGHETLRLVERKCYLYAAANVVGSVVAGLGAAWVGYATVSVLVGG